MKLRLARGHGIDTNQPDVIGKLRQQEESDRADAEQENVDVIADDHERRNSIQLGLARLGAKLDQSVRTADMSNAPKHSAALFCIDETAVAGG